MKTFDGCAFCSLQKYILCYTLLVKHLFVSIIFFGGDAEEQQNEFKKHYAALLSVLIL